MKKNTNRINTGVLMTRRDFLQSSAMTAALLAAGCATNPVSGSSQLMLMSEAEEIDIDRQYAPFQFSSDYGISQDRQLSSYLERVGKGMAPKTHRPQMPYRFKPVNATYVNAYAFPGGSIAATRGILLKLHNEAELASLLGHELGHVNYRHTASQMSKGMLTNTLVGGVSILAASQGATYGQLASGIGGLGAGALLASYSRDNEREADALGLEYMVRSGYSPQGFVGLMDMLRSQSKSNPSSIELMFSTHPMSEERYQTGVATIRDRYQYAKGYPLKKERYMDNTSRLRAMKPAIDVLQQGETLLAKKKYNEAGEKLDKALRLAPSDYTALVTMAKFKILANKDYQGARRYANRARRAYPQEAQACLVGGLSKIKLKRYDEAYRDFTDYDKNLPGNPSIAFFKGYSLEGMQRKQEAGDEYIRYLNKVQEGENAQYAYGRLVEWGRIRQ